MSNDFKPVMVRNVEFKYPRLHATYKYNTAEKRSEECPPVRRVHHTALAGR